MSDKSDKDESPRYQEIPVPENVETAICPYPFYQLFLNPNGMVAPCCYLSQETESEPAYHVGDIKKMSLEEMWNSEKMHTLRKEFLDGNPKICRKQIGINRCNLIRRDLLPKLDVVERPAFPMRKLDLMINGQCNLECAMCDIWKMPNNVYGENGFWEEGPTKIFPYLMEIDCKGGEPFVQKDIYRLIDEVSKVNKKCLWHFTTNGHYKFNDKLISHLNKIRMVRVSVSIDSLNPVTFAKIRKKGDLFLVWRTLNDWIRYNESNRFRININVVVQRDNWQEVPYFIKVCKTKNLAPFFIPLTRPEEFSLFNLTIKERLEIIQYYFQAMSVDKDRVYLRLITPLLDSLDHDQREDVRHRFANTIAETKTYGQSIAEVDY